MPKTFDTLPIISLHADSQCSNPQNLPEIAHLDDPALTVMVDYQLQTAITIKPDAPINEALVEMRACNTHVLLVTDDDHNIVGLLSSEDLLGEKPLQISMERRLRRDEIQVLMVMLSQQTITTLDMNDVRYAKVGNIVNTIHLARQQCALVVEIDEETSKQVVRGMFSLHQISKQLGKDVTFDMGEAPSLYELQHGRRENE